MPGVLLGAGVHYHLCPQAGAKGRQTAGWEAEGREGLRTEFLFSSIIRDPGLGAPSLPSLALQLLAGHRAELGISFVCPANEL